MYNGEGQLLLVVQWHWFSGKHDGDGYREPQLQGIQPTDLGVRQRGPVGLRGLPPERQPHQDGHRSEEESGPLASDHL